ncbi:hypothetical protein [Agrobacterium larrymoorei]|uniref:hypothetical protein n=1 Tax=Agrobacterium larrymoorei TaxID=160699 RepID=UPI0030BDAEF7
MDRILGYKDVSPEANARVSVAEGNHFQGMTKLDLKPAKDAFKEAIDAEDSGKYDRISVFVEDVTEILEMPQVREIYAAWVDEGLA